MYYVYMESTMYNANDADIAAVLHAAVNGTLGTDKAKAVSAEVLKGCLPDGAGGNFAHTMRSSIEMMMLKRTKKMRRGIFVA